MSLRPPVKEGPGKGSSRGFPCALSYKTLLLIFPALSWVLTGSASCWRTPCCILSALSLVRCSALTVAEAGVRNE